MQAASAFRGVSRVWLSRCCLGCLHLQWLFQLAVMEHLFCSQILHPTVAHKQTRLPSPQNRQLSQWADG